MQWLFASVLDRATRRFPARSDEGAVGMLVIGIVIGVLLVIFGIIKFLIPGE